MSKMKLFFSLYSPQILTITLIFFTVFNIQISQGERQIISRKIRQAADEETGENTENSENTEQQEETGEENSNPTEVPEELDPSKSFKCPEEKIEPCTCIFIEDRSTSSTGLRISCTGQTVTQSSINKVLKALQMTNEPPPDSNYSLHLHQFRIQSTLLMTLDLTSFLRVSMKELLIQENYNLSTITGPAFPIPKNNNNNNFQRTTTTTTENPNNPYEVKIQTMFLSFYFNNLNEKGFGRTLEYFDAPFIEKLDLSLNSFTGSSNFLITNQNAGNNNNGNRNWNNREYEFLPGLANLTNLRDLNLGGNKIRKLETGRLKHLVRLENLGLYNNDMEDLSENSLLFDQPNTEIMGEDVNILNPGSVKMLYIWLYNNKLTENRLANKLGIEKMTRRPVNLRLNGNKLTTLPQAKFQTLLETPNTMIFIYLRDNPLKCDKSMLWLKSRRNEFEEKVQNADCKNDRLRNVFTSKLTA